MKGLGRAQNEREERRGRRGRVSLARQVARVELWEPVVGYPADRRADRLHLGDAAAVGSGRPSVLRFMGQAIRRRLGNG